MGSASGRFYKMCCQQLTAPCKNKARVVPKMAWEWHFNIDWEAPAMLFQHAITSTAGSIPPALILTTRLNLVRLNLTVTVSVRNSRPTASTARLAIIEAGSASTPAAKTSQHTCFSVTCAGMHAQMHRARLHNCTRSLSSHSFSSHSDCVTQPGLHGQCCNMPSGPQGSNTTLHSYNQHWQHTFHHKQNQPATFPRQHEDKPSACRCFLSTLHHLRTTCCPPPVRHHCMAKHMRMHPLCCCMLVPQLKPRTRSAPAKCLCFAQLEASHDATTGCTYWQGCRASTAGTYTAAG